MNETHEPWKILLLEDNPTDSELVIHQLGDAAVVEVVINRRDYEHHLLAGPFDAILADWQMPGFHEHDALKMRNALTPKTPFLYVSGVLTNKEFARTLKLGASDFIDKSCLERLEHSLEVVIELATRRIPKESRNPARPAVLLVEDDPDLLELLVQMFSVQQADITTASTVSDALTMVNARKFHVAIVDMKLPDGSGADIIHRLQAVARNCMVVVMSGHPRLGDMVAGLGGYLGLISKPFTVSVAHEILRKHRLNYCD
jgi:DNA-binding NtrC family response regulator